MKLYSLMIAAMVPFLIGVSWTNGNASSGQVGCSNPLLKADFNDDPLDSYPAIAPSGNPDGDSVTWNWNSPLIPNPKVVQSVGDMLQKPLSITLFHDAEVDFTPAQETTAFIARSTLRWRALKTAVNGLNGFFGIESSNFQIIGWIEYTGSGTIKYSGITAAGLHYQANVSQDFELSIDFVNKTTSLIINGIPVPEFQNEPFFSAAAADLGRLRLYGANAPGEETDFAVDDISYCPDYGCSNCLFADNFDKDNVDSHPNVHPYGFPSADSLNIEENGGTIRVMDVQQQDYRMSISYASLQSPRVQCLASPAGGPITGVEVNWRSYSPATDQRIGSLSVLSSDHKYIAMLYYDAGGDLAYNGWNSTGRTYQAGETQGFKITVNYLTKTTALSIDGVPVPGLQNEPFYDLNATDFGSLEFDPYPENSPGLKQLFVDEILVCANLGCCIGSTGNVNKSASETPDLSDLSLLIAYMTVTPRPSLPCLEEANVNASAATNPDLSDLSLLIAYLTVAPRPVLPSCD